MPSRPSLQAWAKMVGPSPSKCSLKRRASFGQHTSKRGLAHFQRIAPQVVTLQFDQVKCVDEDTVVVAVVANEIERGHAQATASPSIMQERERRHANVSTISGKRRVKSLPGRL